MHESYLASLFLLALIILLISHVIFMTFLKQLIWPRKVLLTVSVAAVLVTLPLFLSLHSYTVAFFFLLLVLSFAGLLLLVTLWLIFRHFRRSSHQGD